MQIHATNIKGLGATQVALSFLNAVDKIDGLETVKILVPLNSKISKLSLRGVTLKVYKRYLPNSISRLLECVFSRFFFENVPTIVLGDIPLRGISNQVVLVHQSNLVSPRINKYSSKSLKFRLNRFLFLINNKFAKKIIVQTGVMADDMIKSYPKIKDKVVVCPQPVPNWLNVLRQKKSKSKKIKLFYPSAFYPHKNHNFFLDLDKYFSLNQIELDNVEVLLTLSEEEYEPFKDIKWSVNLGKLSIEEMNFYYNDVDALLFVSSVESYGLPLIESLFVGLPIIVPNLKYAKWMCEENAYFFEPFKEESFIKTLNTFISDYENNRIDMNYDSTLAKFPKSWENVVKLFLKELYSC